MYIPVKTYYNKCINIMVKNGKEAIILYHYIEQQAVLLQPYLAELRKDLHRHPETAWEEERTTEKIAGILSQAGYEIVRGTAVAGHQTGVIATLHGPDPAGPVTVLRFDIDALAISESAALDHLPTAEGFASLHPGKMHACGHDGHTAIGIGCALLLAKIKECLKGTLRFIFQPAEEGARGACPIVERGWLDDADYFLASHIFRKTPDLPPNCNVIPGVSHSLATTKTDLIFHGKAAHAAHPEQGIDVIPAMADLILRLDRSGKDGFLHAGTIQGGRSRNIIADYGKIELETRAPSTESDRELNQILKKISADICAQYHVTCEHRITGSAPSLESSPDFVQQITTLFDKQLERLHPLHSMIPFPASEDAAHMMNRVKEHGGEAAFLLFPTNLAADLHQSDFDFPMEILSTGVTAFSSIVFMLANGKIY